MRRIAMLGSCLLVVGVACAALASAASAEMPELGRCLPAETTPRPHGTGVKYDGKYSNKGCTHVSRKHNGKYEWTPGPGPKPKFIAAGLEPEPVLETTTGAKVECTSMSASGEYTGAKTATLKKILFSGCTSEAAPCQSDPAKEGEIEGTEFSMELGKIEPPPLKKTATAGWDIKKSGEGEAFTYTCGKLPEVRNVQNISGSVIGALNSTPESDVNRMNKTAIVDFKAVAGKQPPEAFTGGEKDTLLNKTITLGLETKEAQVGLTTDFEMEGTVEEKAVESEENKEPLEVKTIEKGGEEPVT
jgi:hypothetical protein